MSRQLTLILGGARSGKSTYAEQLAAPYAEVLYIATAEAWADELRPRIAAHRAQRRPAWRKVEAPRQIGAAIAAALTPATACVLVDCITLLASNVILALPEGSDDASAASAALAAEIDLLLDVYARSSAAWCLVSNEVGLGIVPAYPLGRVYRDALGRANQRLAAVADRVLFMVAGLPLTVK